MIVPKPHLQSIERKPQFLTNRHGKIRLDFAERTMDFSKEILAKIRNSITSDLLNCYPELGDTYSLLAKWVDKDEDSIYLHAGAEQIIKNIFESYINPSDKVLLHYPSFAMYEIYSKLYQATIIPVHSNENAEFDWNQYISAITSDNKLVVIENPSGRLGTVIPNKKLIEILDITNKNGTILILDETYFHFGSESYVDLIDKYDNLFVIRSFSKAFGLAGLRAGMVISQTDNINQLKKFCPVFELNSVASLIIKELINNIDSLQEYTQTVIKQRQEFLKKTIPLGIKVSESFANFVALKLGKNVILELRNELKENNILIHKPYRESYLEDWLMMGIPDGETQGFVLKKIEMLTTKK